VVDAYNQRVQFFDEQGRYLGEFGGNGVEAGQIVNAIDLAIDDDDNLYVSDAAVNRVQKFDADGKFIRQWGSFGSELGQFYKPKGVAVLRDRLLVIDFGNHRGQIFDLEGKPLGAVGEGILSPVPDTPRIFETASTRRLASPSDGQGNPGTLLAGSAVLVTVALAGGALTRRKRRSGP